MAGIGAAFKGVGKAYKNYVKYQKGKVRKGPLGYVDMVEKDILKTHEPGSKWVKEPNPIPTMKKVVKTAVAAPIVVTGVVKGTQKIKKKLKERKDKKDQRKGPGKAEGGRIGFKRGKAVTKADLAKRDLWRKRILKKRSKIGQRKSKWDVQGAISGHPLNPFRMHAEGKALDWTSKRKDVYVRTRDDLKKSQDPKVRGVAEGFQQMDYKDKAKGTQFEKDYEPKLTKRTHVGRQFRKAGKQ